MAWIKFQLIKMGEVSLVWLQSWWRWKINGDKNFWACHAIKIRIVVLQYGPL
jgi:hypothetical protein